MQGAGNLFSLLPASGIPHPSLTAADSNLSLCYADCTDEFRITR